MADVVFACINDWANVGWVFKASLESVGVSAVALRTGKAHPFGYPEQAKGATLEEIQKEIDQARAVMFMHTQWPGDLVLEGKKVAVFHGGSWYRQEPERWNAFWNPKVDVTAIQTADLLDKGAKNQVWIMPSVDTDFLEPNRWFAGGKLVFAHYPRKASKKGSGHFLSAMAPYHGKKSIFHYSEGKVPWLDNMKRLSLCDVYLESQEHTRRGKTGKKPLGFWGTAAMEAASMGKIVVTCFRQRKRHEEEFGKSPIMAANNPEELATILRRLHAMPIEEIVRRQQAHREWAVRCHSRKTVGRRLLEKVF
jgi:hypothetical protein